MNYMFSDASAFDQDLSQWSLDSIEKRLPIYPRMFNFLSGSGMSKDNFCKLKALPIWKDYDLGLESEYICP